METFHDMLNHINSITNPKFIDVELYVTNCFDKPPVLIPEIYLGESVSSELICAEVDDIHIRLIFDKRHWVATKVQMQAIANASSRTEMINGIVRGNITKIADKVIVDTDTAPVVVDTFFDMLNFIETITNPKFIDVELYVTTSFHKTPQPLPEMYLNRHISNPAGCAEIECIVVKINFDGECHVLGPIPRKALMSVMSKRSLIHLEICKLVRELTAMVLMNGED